jgi:hypothetical protein
MDEGLAAGDCPFDAGDFVAAREEEEGEDRGAENMPPDATDVRVGSSNLLPWRAETYR